VRIDRALIESGLGQPMDLAAYRLGSMGIDWPDHAVGRSRQHACDEYEE
jgi:hypothetical protein